MISGKHWSESPYLVECLEQCDKSAKEDAEFSMRLYEDSLRGCLKKKIKEWTWVEKEREAILNEMIEEFVDNKGGLK